MEDFAIYNIPYMDIDWHSIQPTFFHEGNSSNKQWVNEIETSTMALCENVNYENTRPVSAYAMFFKERQIMVKKSFPQATFGDISRIVAAEWDSLERNEKSAYKRRADQLRKMHIKMAVKEKVQRICSSSGSSVEKEDDKGLIEENKKKRMTKPLTMRLNSNNESM